MVLFRDIIYQPLRKSYNATAFKECFDNQLIKFEACSPLDPAAIKMRLGDIPENRLKLQEITRVIVKVMIYINILKHLGRYY